MIKHIFTSEFNLSPIKIQSRSIILRFNVIVICCKLSGLIKFLLWLEKDVLHCLYYIVYLLYNTI